MERFNSSRDFQIEEEYQMTKKRFNIVATVYDKRGRKLTEGNNSYTKTHTLQAKFAVQVGLDDKIYLHAEISALSKLKKGQKPYRIFVERYKENGEPALAKCCKVCEAAVKAHGIKYIEYTNNGPEFTKETFDL